MAIEFNGNVPQLRNLAIKTTFLTLVTLGIYRFWARTRIRQYFWSSIAPEGHPLEYTGRGIEKLLGFLIAVAVLAVYLGILQLLLSFAGMSLFNADSDESPIQALIVTYITFFAVLPLIYYAQYRARRYMLSRTRWRGIRFGADQAAWAYTWRALGHLVLTVVTLGLLLPRQTFFLEKFKTDRTWIGQSQLYQGGHWTGLYPSMKHLFIAFGILAIAVVILAFSVDYDSFAPNAEGTGLEGDFLGGGSAVLGFILIFAGMIWLFVGQVYYRVHSVRYLTFHKMLDGGIEFETTPQTRRVIGIYFWGSLKASLLASVIGGAIGASFVGLAIVLFSPEVGAVVGLVMTYVLFILVYSVLSLIFITQPFFEYIATQTTIVNPEALDDLVQRDADDFAEAEGFADALDLGAAI